MASTHRAPKQWCLSKVETINSFENWKQNLIYTLSLDSNFALFLAEGVTWRKKTKAQPLRGFVDDGESVPTAKRLTARQKTNFLELMLGQIANYCPIISRSTLVKSRPPSSSFGRPLESTLVFRSQALISLTSRTYTLLRTSVPRIYTSD